MSQEASPRSTEQFMVRLPKGMRARIADAAEASGRSMNAEVVARLAQTLDGGSVTVTGESITVDTLVRRLAEAVRPSA